MGWVRENEGEGEGKGEGKGEGEGEGKGEGKGRGRDRQGYWMLFSDAQKRRVLEAEVLNSEAFMLFYDQIR